MVGKPGWDCLDPLKPLKLPPEYSGMALQAVLRRAVREHWERIKIQETLEALGLVEPPSPVPGNPPPPPEAPVVLSEPVTGIVALAEERWCGRGLHALVGDNLAVSRVGKRQCRRCREIRENRRRVRDRARRLGRPDPPDTEIEES